jgi:hypothetical protein
VPVRQHDYLGRAKPFLRARFASNEAFSQASVDEVLGHRRAAARE